MASYESSFNEFSDDPLPEIIYLDTSFFIDALVDGQKYHAQSMGFIERLARYQPIIIFSELLISEIRCAILSICIRNKLGPKTKVLKQRGIEDLPRYKADCSIWTVNGWSRYKTRHSIRD